MSGLIVMSDSKSRKPLSPNELPHRLTAEQLATMYLGAETLRHIAFLESDDDEARVHANEIFRTIAEALIALPLLDPDKAREVIAILNRVPGETITGMSMTLQQLLDLKTEEAMGEAVAALKRLWPTRE